MGTPDYAAQILEDMIQLGAEFSLVVSQPDRPVGRKQELLPTAVKSVALKHNLPLLQPEKLSEIKLDLIDLKPTAIIVAAFGQILSQEILDIAPCYNLHASLLPLYRGAAPIQASILNGDKVTGMTIMKMDRGLDTGDIVAFNTMDTSDLNASDLMDKLARSGASLMIKVLENLSRSDSIRQHSCDSSYVTKVKKTDGLVSFNNASDLARSFKAYTPWPGIFLDSSLALLDLDLIRSDCNYKAGEILSIQKEGVEVGCEIGSVLVKSVKAPSKNATKAVDYINGKRLTIGDTLA